MHRIHRTKAAAIGQGESQFLCGLPINIIYFTMLYFFGDSTSSGSLKKQAQNGGEIYASDKYCFRRANKCINVQDIYPWE